MRLSRPSGATCFLLAAALAAAASTATTATAAPLQQHDDLEIWLDASALGSACDAGFARSRAVLWRRGRDDVPVKVTNGSGLFASLEIVSDGGAAVRLTNADVFDQMGILEPGGSASLTARFTGAYRGFAVRCDTVAGRAAVFNVVIRPLARALKLNLIDLGRSGSVLAAIQQEVGLRVRAAVEKYIKKELGITQALAELKRAICDALDRTKLLHGGCRAMSLLQWARAIAEAGTTLGTYIQYAVSRRAPLSIVRFTAKPTTSAPAAQPPPPQPPAPTPPSQPQPPSPQPPTSNGTVSWSAPSDGATLSGVVRLSVAATGAAQVHWHAHYATDPTNNGTIAWREIGRDTYGSDGWAMDFDTATIPDQGNAGLGTVNLVAILVNNRGALTDVRAYRRVDIRNSTAPVSAQSRLEVVREVSVSAPSGLKLFQPLRFSFAARNGSDSPVTVREFRVPVRGPWGDGLDVRCAGGANVTLAPGQQFDCDAYLEAGYGSVGTYTYWADWLGTDDKWHVEQLGPKRQFTLAAPSPGALTLTTSLAVHAPSGFVTGQPLNFSFSVKNTGEAPLSIAMFSVPVRWLNNQSLNFDAICAGGQNLVLAPGASFTCMASRTFPNVGAHTFWADWMDGNGQWHENQLGTHQQFTLTGSGPALSDGWCVQAADPTVWYIQNGKKRGFPNPESMLSICGSWTNVRAVSVGELATMPVGPDMPRLRDGTCIQASDATVWILSQGLKRGFPDPPTMLSYCGTWSNVVRISDAELATIPLGDEIPRR